MLGYDRRASGKIDLLLKQDAHCWRLGVAANQTTMGVAVHDCIADDVDGHAFELLERISEIVEANALCIHQGHQLLSSDLRRSKLDQRRRRVDNISRGEDHLSTILVENRHLLLRLRI